MEPDTQLFLQTPAPGTEKIPEIKTLDFRLPAELEAGEPPEARGLARDQVRLMVSYRRTNRILHTEFHRLPDFLDPGDLLVVNASGTLNAALNAAGPKGQWLELHVSTRLPAGLWVVELRRPTPQGTIPLEQAASGDLLRLPGGGEAVLLTPYREEQRWPSFPQRRSHVRLWVAALHLPLPVDEYLERYGFPIRYKYVREGWPNSYYQTVYATEKGSAEMPSAGRAFTQPLIDRLNEKGIGLAPLILHTGVASLEEQEPPYDEPYRVPVETARRMHAARASGKRIIAVGTTSVRALETVVEPDGTVHAGEGWTRLVITPERGIRAVDGLITGFHEPRSTHLAMLAALAGFEHLRLTYSQALQQRYLWHEFGDLHLILP